MESIYLTIVLAPLLGSVVAGLFGKQIGRAGAHWVTILGVAIAFGLSLLVLKHHVLDMQPAYNQTLYTWMTIQSINFEIGFLVDNLTALMMVVVTSVSLLVHIYTIGYMHDDPGYQRFFSYISLFTFSMLMLVMSNNFLQLFFGWEAVGLVSYLLIGFWFKKPTAIYANMKAFLVNRVGDFGFLLGIAAILLATNSLDYASVFQKADGILTQTISVLPGSEWPMIHVICIGLFIGAMGKSAQVPLHVWLPDSMEGPTPISALIHAATMVTAGIFMVARMSPLFELSDITLTTILIVGATTAFFMGLIGIVQNDIKRVVAYSTLSQLGYMVVALGASAYSVAIFHLMTHAFFKALLFLGAGSVIIAMHHEQDMRNMGGLRKYMPITYWTALIGSLALIGFPGFSGFYSKDMIIEAVHHSNTAGAQFAYWAVLSGVFVTAFYTFRMFFMTFHGQPRMDEHTREHLHETPKVVTVPLILLAIPSVIIGGFTIGPLVYGEVLQSALYVNPDHDVIATLASHYHGPIEFISHAMMAPPVYLAAVGVIAAWYFTLKNPAAADNIKQKMAGLYRLLENKYGFDDFNDKVFAAGTRALANLFWKIGDIKLIDGLIVNGSARSVAWVSSIVRQLQTGYLYHYAFAMIIGLLILLTWLLW